jgi:glycosyltransferase involved in cell wall biosynthesis
MAVLAIVTSSPPNVEGGHLVIARALVNAAREVGHDAHLVVTTDYGFGRTSQSYLGNWRADVRSVEARKVNQVISLRYPSYAVRHPAHVCWLNHPMREYYDLWSEFSSTISSRARVKENVRKAAIRAADWWLLHFNVTSVVAQSHTIQRRLANDLAVRAPVLWPPAPQRAYRCEDYGEYIFVASRLTAHKRIDLAVRALAEPGAGSVRLVIAGEGEMQSPLEALVRQLGLDGRVRFVGRAGDAEVLDHLARCRAVCFPPLGEDYGFVTVEAFSSRKAVVTCRDSGGPTELVHDGETGLICEPTPRSLAAAFARVMEDRDLAEQMGGQAAAIAATMSWSEAVERLVIV